MKTTKKIFAAVLAVMMIALMIPFSASAATTLTVTCNPNAGTTGDKADYVGTYEYKFFKLATVDTTTGTVTVEEAYASNTALVNALNSTDTDKSKKIITICDGMSWTGTADKTVTFKYDGSANVLHRRLQTLQTVSIMYTALRSLVQLSLYRVHSSHFLTSMAKTGHTIMKQ